MYTDKKLPLNPRNGIRAQANRDGPMPLETFFRPSEETKDKTKEKNTSPNLCENKEGMRLRARVLLIIYCYFFFYIKTKYGTIRVPCILVSLPLCRCRQSHTFTFPSQLPVETLEANNGCQSKVMQTLS